ncbi:hypothetical protein EZV73_05505 [Acidaminobacter sp. JC074]|uniref:family 43 glycosylhydrolase n=1 Tax=Acidaminobacter sp. JC074 TaxID=2530199 RepID=UPI001F0D0568|nr:family 43 glycosylhydrolase [Acidaminobacter sp. JC074]MCH4887013.1 hypothetical protein [Acidaminobacter sp. JC074]
MKTILLKGDEKKAYRDPAVYFENDTFYMYFTYVDNCENGPYLRLAMTTSRDLVEWTEVTFLTEKDKSKNYSSPGNIIKHQGLYYLCIQTYPRENGEKYGNINSRVYFITSKDLLKWSEPEPIMVKGQTPLEDLGRMIDPYIIKDRQEEKYWCFFKQNGASFSSSYDLKHWTFEGSVECGENLCVLDYNHKYRLYHSPHNGIGILESEDLRSFKDLGTLYLGQEYWTWAKGRLTAGFVLQVENEKYPRYLMFFHGSGPEDESIDFDKNASIGLAWSHDLENWEWADES